MSLGQTFSQIRVNLKSIKFLFTGVFVSEVFSNITNLHHILIIIITFVTEVSSEKIKKTIEMISLKIISFVSHIFVASNFKNLYLVTGQQFTRDLTQLGWHRRGQRIGQCDLIDFIIESCNVLVEFTHSLHFLHVRKLILTIFSERDGLWTCFDFR